jgi:hypothetical protein
VVLFRVKGTTEGGTVGGIDSRIKETIDRMEKETVSTRTCTMSHKDVGCSEEGGGGGDDDDDVNGGDDDDDDSGGDDDNNDDVNGDDDGDEVLLSFSLLFCFRLFINIFTRSFRLSS